MKKANIAEQVAELSQQQQKTILKIGKTVTIIGCIIFALWFLWTLMGYSLLMDPPVTVELDSGKILLGILAGCAVMFLCMLALILFVRIKYPYYSDAKLSYIKKLHKGKVAACAVPEKAAPADILPSDAENSAASKASPKRRHLGKVILLFIFLYISFLGQGAQAAFNAEADFNSAYTSASLNALISLAILSVAMMIVPFICKTTKKELLTSKTGKKICLWNSIILFLLSLVLSSAQLPIPVAVGGVGAVIFYFINKWIFVDE